MRRREFIAGGIWTLVLWAVPRTLLAQSGKARLAGDDLRRSRMHLRGTSRAGCAQPVVPLDPSCEWHLPHDLL